jgi:hypothetical protein
MITMIKQKIQEQFEDILLDMERGILVVQPYIADENAFKNIEEQH